MRGNKVLVASRSLTVKDGTTQKDLTVRIWMPERIDESKPDSEFECEFEVSGLFETVRETAVGSDSMQALESALAGVYEKLRPFGDSITWHGMPYSSFAMVIAVSDAGRKRRILDILAEEEYALEQRRALLEQTREARQTQVRRREP